MTKIFLSLLNELKRFGGLLGAGLVAIVPFAVIPASATPINISFTNSLGETYKEDGFTFTRYNGTPGWSLESGSGSATDWLNIHDHKVEGHYLELTSAAGAFGAGLGGLALFRRRFRRR